jgi:hypothetical protein
MSGLTGVLAAIGLLGVAQLLLDARGPGGGTLSIALIWIFLSTWVANMLAIARPKL